MSRRSLGIFISGLLLLLLLSATQCSAEEESRPETGMIIKDMDREGCGVLTINNNWTMDTVAILANSLVRPKMVFYLRSKESIEIDGIEDGEYIPYFTIGTGWNFTTMEFDQVYGHYRYAPVLFETVDLGDEFEGTVQELDLYEADSTNFIPGQFEFPRL